LENKNSVLTRQGIIWFKYPLNFLSKEGQLCLKELINQAILAGKELTGFLQEWPHRAEGG
jgi:hypothetical protein